MKRPFLVGVIGGGAVSPAVADSARRVGRAIGAASCHLICGGRLGVMESACRGHHEGRGEAEQPGVTIGLLPGSDRDEANEWVDVVLPTGLGLARNTLVVNGAEAVIAVAGGSGTLNEIAMAWQLGRPLVALANTGGWAGRLAGQALDQKRKDTIVAATTVEEAVKTVLRVLNGES
jgi:uncharacterized protein (TIGR00725 family)